MHAVEDWAGCRNLMIAAAEAKLEWNRPPVPTPQPAIPTSINKLMGERISAPPKSTQVLLSSLELVAKTDARIVVGRPVSTNGLGGRTKVVDEEVVREATGDLRVHNTSVEVDVLGEAPVDDHLNRIQGASALVG